MLIARRLVLVLLAASLFGCDDRKGASDVRSEYKTEYRTVFWDEAWNENPKDTLLDGNMRVQTATYKSGRSLTVRCFKFSSPGSRPTYDLRYSINVPLLTRIGADLQKAVAPQLVVAVDGISIGVLEASIVVDDGGISFLAPMAPDFLGMLSAAKKSIVSMPRQNNEKLDAVIEFGVGNFEKYLVPVQQACAGAVAPGKAPSLVPKKTDDEIIADSSRGLLANPMDANAYIARANAYMNKKAFDLAIADFNKAMEVDAENNEPLVGRARAYKEMEQVDLALADYTKAIDRSPQQAELHSARGYVYELKADYSKAISDLTSAVQMEPKSADYWMQLGRLYFDSGNFGLAADALSKAIELQGAELSGYTLLYEYMAQARLNGGGKQELLDGMARLKSKSWPYPVAEYFAGQRKVEAVLSLAKDDDERCEAHFYIGQAHLLSGAPLEAEKHFKTASETCPRTFFEYFSAIAEIKRLRR